MQAPPAHEGMFLHGILHRIEGDFDNARAWYGNVGDGSEVMRCVWGEGGGVEKGRAFVDRVEGLVKRGEGDRGVLERESVREIKAVVEFCRGRFGEGAVGEASGAFTGNDEMHRRINAEMVSGGKGFRRF